MSNSGSLLNVTLFRFSRVTPRVDARAKFLKIIARVSSPLPISINDNFLLVECQIFDLLTAPAARECEINLNIDTLTVSDDPKYKSDEEKFSLGPIYDVADNQIPISSENFYLRLLIYYARSVLEESGKP